ncbi:hypothetical protein L7F22_031592 [Adiantum nelumboides]|nr:hypothetical protein [Adiantum nelumboides]
MKETSRGPAGCDGVLGEIADFEVVAVFHGDVEQVHGLEVAKVAGQRDEVVGGVAAMELQRARLLVRVAAPPDLP